MAATRDRGESLFASGRAPLTIGLVLGVTMIAIESLAVSTAMPAVTEDLGGLDLYGWAFSAFMLGNIIGIVATGEQADRRGPAGPFLLGLALFAAGLLAAGIAPTMFVLVLGRALQGLGGGAVFSTLYVATGLGYPPQVRSRMLALLSSAWVIPGLLGPALAGAVTEQFGWRAVFLGMVPLPLVVVGLVLPGLRPLGPAASDAVPGGRRRARTRHALVLVGGITLILVGTGNDDPLSVAVPAVAGVALAWPALRRLLPTGTFRARPGIPSAVATRALANIAFFGVDAFVPLALTAVKGQRAVLAGLPLTTAALAWASGSWWQSRARRGPCGVALTGAASIVVGIAGMIGVLHPAAPWWAGVIAWTFAGLGMGLLFNPTSVVVLALADPKEMGTQTSSLQLADALGVAIGTGAVGAVVGAFEHAGRSTAAALALGFGSLLAVLLLTFAAARGMPVAPVDAPDEPDPVDPADLPSPV